MLSSICLANKTKYCNKKHKTLKEVYSLGCQKIRTTKDKIIHVKDIMLMAAAVGFPLTVVAVVLESTR